MKIRTWREQAGTYACTALAAAAMVGCGGAPSGGDSVAIDVDGIPELYAPLSPWGGTCALTQGGTTQAPTFTAVLTFPIGGGTLVLSKRAVDSAVLINGYPTNDTNSGCGTGAALVTATNLKALTVNGASGVVDTLILDYMNGSFGAVGASAGVPDGTNRGILVDLGGGDAGPPIVPDAVKIRGQTAVDNVVLGTKSTGVVDISMVTATAVDIEVKDVAGTADPNPSAGSETTNDTRTSDPKFTIATAGGNDTFRFGGTRAASDTCASSTSSTDSVAGSAVEFPIEVFGGDGNDTFNMGADAKSGASTFGDVILHGGAGTDTASYAERAEPLYLSPDGTSTTSGDRTAVLMDREGDLIEDDIETVIGGLCGDVLVAAANAGGATVTLNGGPGDDYFVEAASSTAKTVFTGAAGTDTVSYAARSIAVVVTIGAGVNDGETGELDDVGATIERVIGGAGNDTLTAGTLGSRLCGGGGDDTLNGGAGADIFESVVLAVTTFSPDGCVPGDGSCNATNNNDTSLLCDDAGSQTISGGAGVDLVDFSNRGADSATAPCPGSAVQDPTSAADATAAVSAEGVTFDASSSATIENIWGSCGPDVLTGNTANNELVGGGAPTTSGDTLTSGAGEDTVEGNGLAGDDVNCGAGDDLTVNVDLAATVDCEL